MTSAPGAALVRVRSTVRPNPSGHVGSARSRAAASIAALFVVGLALRVGTLWASRGGPSGDLGYDSSVYFTAADALVHGRLPYRDFVLLHPPGVMLALAPFGALGRIIGDHDAFMAADATFSALGAATGAALFGVARRLGLRVSAALLGASFYEVWFGAVGPETATRLEPLGNLLFACGLFAFSGRRSTRSLMITGALLGGAVSVKIWWLVPVLLVHAWMFRTVSRRDALVALGATAASATVINAPFFAAAPSAMWHMVILNQVGRNPNDPSRLVRAEQFFSLRTAFPHLTSPLLVGLVAALAVGLTALGALAWRERSARLFVIVATAQIVVLAAAPSYFAHYSDFAACGTALVVAGAAQRTTPTRRRHPWLAWAAVAAAAALTVAAAFVRMNNAATPFPRGLASRVTGVRCLMADSPMALIELNALSRDLAHGCPNWVDVTGRTYGIDKANIPRRLNPQWQRDLRRYLTSGDAYILIRPGTGYSPTTERFLNHQPVIASVDGIRVHRVVHHS